MTTLLTTAMPPAPPAAGRPIGCDACMARHSCLPPLGAADRAPVRRIRVARGAALYTAGALVGDYVYVVRYGCFKLSRRDRSGAGVVLGFPGSGDFLALEAIGLVHHDCSAVALEDSEVCEIGYGGMREQAQFFQGIISHSIRDMQDVLLQQRRTTAEQRLAAFLLRQSAWHAARGCSGLRYRLPMARQDIAAFLNLTPECLSRLLGRFRRLGLLAAARHDVTLLDRAALEALAAPARTT
ncbi:Crp/Fnr family transcriptional regulator [Pseudoduganella aquatica]|uniref:Crp/Fnr family transcriptional regulator n=1 Tax=Pseudoduganella aquatica TaxID=2660641 RepID=UPI001E4343ED|nr:Crp/Fnr family transcriptional regulator [Pseudoduganella aquatica]